VNRSSHKVLVGNLEGRKQHGRPKDRYDNNIKTDSKKTRFVGVNCIKFAQGRIK
jgi:hypothetical protein